MKTKTLVDVDLKDLAEKFGERFDEIVEWKDIERSKQQEMILKGNTLKEVAFKDTSLLKILGAVFTYADALANQKRGLPFRLIWRVKPELRIKNFEFPSWANENVVKVDIPIEFSIYMRFAVEEF